MQESYKNRDAFLKDFVRWSENKITYTQALQGFVTVSDSSQTMIRKVRTSGARVSFYPAHSTKEKYLEIITAKELDKEHYANTSEMKMIEVYSVGASRERGKKVKSLKGPNPTYLQEQEDKWDDKKAH